MISTRPSSFVTAAIAIACLSALATTRAEPESPRPPKSTTFPLDGHTLLLPSPVTFLGNTTDLDEPASAAALYHIADYLEAKKAITLLRLEAHVASTATLNPEAAQALSEKRALAVARWLIAHNTPAARLLPVGFGNTKPVATPADNPANTRLTPINAQLLKRNIGNLPPDSGGKPATPYP